MREHTKIRIAGLVAAAALATSVGQTQVISVGDTEGRTATGVEPGSPAGSYALSGFDTVNLFNGHLNFVLPLLQIGGRGESGYTMVLPIERNWAIDHFYNYEAELHSYTPTTNLSPWTHWWSALAPPPFSPGLVVRRRAGSAPDNCSMINPVVFTVVRTVLTFISSDGSEHELVDRNSGGREQGAGCASAYSRGRVFEARDGSAISFLSDGSITDYQYFDENNVGADVNGWLFFPNGLRYHVVNSLIVSIMDRHGNVTTMNYNIYNQLTSVVDPLGRTTTLNPTSTGTTIEFPGAGGATRTITIAHATLDTRLSKDDATGSLFAIKTYVDLFAPYGGGSTAEFNPTVVSSVTLPDNRMYQFRYNSYGELARVTLPTGGQYRYSYCQGVAGSSVVGVTPYYLSVYRRVTEKRVYTSGSDNLDASATLLGKIVYSVSHPASSEYTLTSNTVVTAETSDKDGVILKKEEHSFYGGANDPRNSGSTDISYNHWRQGKEFRTRIQDGAGRLLRQIDLTWEQRTCLADEVCVYNAQGINPGSRAQYYQNDPRTTVDVTTWADTVSGQEPATAQVTKRTYGYDRYNNRTETIEYALGQSADSLAALRKSTAEYLTGNFYDTIALQNPTALTTYHLRDRVTKQQVIDPATNAVLEETVYEIDGNGATSPNLIQATVPMYDADWKPDANNGRANTHRGNVTKVKRWLASQSKYISISFTYDMAGNKVSEVDPRNNETQFSFGPSLSNGLSACSVGPTETYAYLTKVTNALSQITDIRYDCALGKPVQQIERAPQSSDDTSTSFTYESTGLDRLQTVTYPIGSMTISYNDPANTVTTTRPQNSCSTTRNVTNTQNYNGLGQVVGGKSISAEGDILTSVEQDVLGRTIRIGKPYYSTETEVSTRIEYDALDRPTRVTYEDGAVQTTTYVVNRAIVTDPAGKTITRISDSLGRITGVIEPATSILASTTTTYTYDAKDRLLSVDQAGQTRTFRYDTLGRLICASNPETRVGAASCENATWQSAGLQLYDYDDAGNLVGRKDARGKVAQYTPIDALNRVRGVVYSAPDTTPSVSYTYDTCRRGKLCTVSNSNVTRTYTYDMMGRATSVTQAHSASESYTTSYEYDLAGNRQAVVYPSLRRVTECHDTANRSLQLVYGAANSTDAYVSSLSYAPSGGVKRLRLGSGLYERTRLNTRDQVEAIALGPTDTEPSVYQSGDLWWLSNRYTTDQNNGNVRGQVQKAPKKVSGLLTLDTTYGYDSRNRLNSTVETTVGESPEVSWTWNLGHDAWGNMWTTTGSTTIPVASGTPTAADWYDSTTNRLAKSSGGVALPAGTYDSAGNLQSHPDFGQMTYDAENRMTGWSGGRTVTYQYDGEGHRVRRIGTAGTTTYVYGADGELVAEYGASEEAGVGGRTYLTTDHLGSVRVVTTATGAVVSRRDYFPFGEQIPASVTYGKRSEVDGYNLAYGGRLQFTGKERDSDSGLDYFGARYYSGAQGRMTSPDPFLIMLASENREQLDAYLVNPQNWNRYVYALNNPLRYIDPTGLDPISISDCQNDPDCTVVKVNVILDKGADIYDKDGNLRQDYQAKLDSQLAQAADEYGNAKIAFDVNYTSGTITRDNTVTGGVSGALNVVVTDSRDSYANNSWLSNSGKSYTRLNIGTSQTDTVAHEFSHHLTGDTRSWGIPLLSNAIADYNNDVGRAILRNWNNRGGRILRAIDPFLYLHRRDVMQNARRWYGGR